MELTAQAAGWFLLAAVPFGAFTIYSDLSRMKIPNLATDGLAVAFLIIGFFVLPFQMVLWGIAGFVIATIAVILLNALGLLAGGDGKFIAAATPYVMFGDLRLLIALLAACLLGAVVTHRVAKLTPLRNLVPHWASWEQGKRFPMGFPLAMTLILYLLIVARLG